MSAKKGGPKPDTRPARRRGGIKEFVKGRPAQRCPRGHRMIVTDPRDPGWAWCPRCGDHERSKVVT